MQSADEEWDDMDEEDWEDEGDSSFNLFLVTNTRIAIGVTLVILLLLCSVIFTNFGFYSGAGSLAVLIDVNEGKDASDDTFTFNILATSPSFGKLAKEGSYKVSVTPSAVEGSDSSVTAASGSFSLDDNGRSTVSISYSDLFMMNGEYTVQVELGSQKDTDSVSLNKFAESSVIDIFRFDGSEPIDKDSGLITNLHFNSELLQSSKIDSSTDQSVIVVPSVTGTITIYHSEEVFDNGKDEDYWDNDGSRNPVVVEVLDFIYSGDTLKMTYDSGNFEDGPNFNPVIFDISEFYDVEGSGDYAISIEFSNDLGTDDSTKSGQSTWKWFHICKVQNGECDGNN